MVPSVHHLYQELLSILHTILHIRVCPPKVLQVQNRLGVDTSSFRAKFADNVTADQCMCYREDFTHWISNFHSHYMKRDESCLFANCVQNAQKFLVQVLNRGNHGTETMDRLSFNWYHHRKSMTITDLPPTSYAREGHIQSAIYATYMQVNCLGDISQDPQQQQQQRPFNGL